MKLLKALSKHHRESAAQQPAVKPDKGYGIKSNWWVWVSKLPIGVVESDEKQIKAQGKLKTPFDSWSARLKNQKPKESTEEQVQLKDDKQKDDRKVKTDKVEADASSGNAQALRAEAKESNNDLKINAKLLEANAEQIKSDGNKFRCILITEGMGNFKDAFYYSREALESSVELFEGKKVYADHPSRGDEISRPERSVRDILGHFESVELVVDNKTGQSHVEADVVILPDEPYDWARVLLKHSIEYSKSNPDKEFIGFSINASGDADVKPIDEVIGLAPEGAQPKLLKAKQELGLTEVRVVSKITDAVSCDLVTEAGAGGKVLQLIEQEKSMKTKKVKESEAKAKAEEKKEAGHPAGAAEAADPAAQKPEGADAAHADAEQDKELISQMIAKYLGGEDGSHSAEEMEMAHEAYQCYKEMGHAEDECAMKASDAVKLAKHMAKKQAEAEEAKAPVEDKETPAEEQVEEAEEAKKESAEAKESNKVVELTGKIALLESKISKYEFNAHLDKMLKESGMPMSMTKKFRDLEEVKECKSEKELNKLFKLFKEGSSNSSSGEALKEYDFLINTEKTTTTKTSSKGLSFEDCVK